MGRQILGAPLAEAFAGNGSAVAEFCGEGFYKPFAANVGIEGFVNDLVDILEKVSPVDKSLIIGGGVGDIKVIALTAIKLRVYAV